MVFLDFPSFSKARCYSILTVLSLFDPLLIVLNESGVLLDAEFDDLDFKSITGAKTGKPDLNLLFPANANPLLLEAPTFTAFLSCICDCINWAPKRTQKHQKVNVSYQSQTVL